jgi:hypothetical protein
MGKRKGKKQRRRPKLPKQAQPQPLPPTPPREHGSTWKTVGKKFPRWLWTVFSLFAVLAGLYVLYPSLSINEDYSFDSIFPYNTSFSITNEGYWPMADVSITCSADFTMRPWTTDPSDKSGMTLHTKDDEYKDFAKTLPYKHRLTLPCNHNVVANGHRIDPDAKLHIVVAYRFAGTNIKRHQAFDFRTVMGWDGQSYWEYK